MCWFIDITTDTAVGSNSWRILLRRVWGSLYSLGFGRARSVDKATRVHSVRCRWLHWPGKCLAFSVPVLQEWRRSLSDPVLDLSRSWWNPHFPARDWHGSVYGTWRHWGMGIGALFQGHRMGIIGDRFLAQRLLHCYLGVELVLSLPGTGRLVLICLQCYTIAC